MIPTSNLGAMLLQTARRLPDRPGLIWRDRVWSWAEIAARACAAAAGLRARGIGAGDRVLIHSRNNNAIFEGVWADRELIEVGAQSLKIVSRNGLITMKEIAGRPQDLADISALRSMGNQ